MAESGWRESDVFTPLERDVLKYAEAMTHTPPTVTDELSARLLAALGAPALPSPTSSPRACWRRSVLLRWWS